MRLLLVLASVAAFSLSPAAAQEAPPNTAAETAAYPAWGALNHLIGQEWFEDTFSTAIRLEWREPGRVMVMNARQNGPTWNDSTLLTLGEDGVIRIATGGRRGVIELTDAGFDIVYGGMILPMRQSFTVADGSLSATTSGRDIRTMTANYQLVGGPGFAPPAPRGPSAPIIVAQGQGSGSTSPLPPGPAPTTNAPAPRGPIVIASAPPAAAPARLAPTPGMRTVTMPPPPETSREARMAAQVQQRRDVVAAEQRRQAELAAAQERAAEEARARARAEERQRDADRSAFWGGVYQGLTVLNEVVQGELAESQAALDLAINQANQQAAEQRQAERERAEQAERQRQRQAQTSAGGSVYQGPINRTETGPANREAEVAAARRREAEQQATAQARAQADAQRLAEAERRAAQQRAEREAAQAERDRIIDWPQAVVLCSQPASDGQTRNGAWRCEGPLNMTYVRFGSPTERTYLGQACGGNVGGELGTAGTYRVIGCDFGLRPGGGTGSHRDPALRLGVGYIPGRGVYRCRASLISEICSDR